MTPEISFGLCMHEPLHVHMCIYTPVRGRWEEGTGDRTMGDGVGQMNSSENRGDNSREADSMGHLDHGCLPSRITK